MMAKSLHARHGEAAMGNLRYHVWIYVGVMVLLLGLQLRMVETYTFTSDSTRMMNDWFGSGSGAPAGAIERWAVSQNMVQKQYRPPAWLGYALLSAGGVMVVHGWFLRKA
jgi:hypothetical protein